ncbi:formate/nitrite transporter family protein [Corynebacterium sp. CCUG 71335]|uniref:formate/nitrite transporter family protein n=1 Tax=Corynebacterium sp. CCUG 71335 TaxID=2823892 RepID=UPI00210D4B81|nr:formate/nitrite transporter family protein [Corynebacterium sp. CCUG 71335]MCQ4620677.1 formate/nitrite transporter family protein [Corynebacterium sp. CCUG 71335]
MNFHKTAPGIIGRKLDLFSTEPSRFAVRAIMAGVYLGIMTSFAAATGTIMESYAPGWGGYVFAAIFATTLYIIIVLQGELATGDMMFMTYGAVTKHVSLLRGLALILFVTLFNLVGAVVICWLISHTVFMSNIDPESRLLHTVLENKLAKPTGGLFVEAILANMVVNIAFMMSAQAGQDFSAKLLGIVVVIPAFAAMSYEHSIANFVMVQLGGFVYGPETIDGFTIANILRNWSVVWLGNMVGGGLIMGGVYGWLNLTKTEYKD